MKTLSLPLLLFAAVLPASADIQWAGVNLSGAEFGQNALPGTYNSTYTYPTTAEVDYYHGKGMNFIRLPFRWERWQHTNSAALDTTELSRAQAVIAYATKNGMTVLLDPHNFQRYYPYPRASYETATNGLVGTTVPNTDFSNFWWRVASIYKTNPLVIFGLNNEPANMSTDQLATSENAAIAGIRAAGAGNTIFVPGNAYTGAWTWNMNYYGTANSVAMLRIVDPSNNMVFEAHQYLDSDGSGTTTNIADIQAGPTRLQPFTDWLRANHRKGFLGEFAVANNTIGGTNLGGPTLSNMLSYVSANSDVWLGWAWWGGGPWWGSGYMFAIDPLNLGQPSQSDQPVMGVLKHFLPLPTPMLSLVNGTKLQLVPPKGFVYRVQSRPDLAVGQWTDSGASFAGTGASTNISLPVGPGQAVFYRVKIAHAQ